MRTTGLFLATLLVLTLVVPSAHARNTHSKDPLVLEIAELIRLNETINVLIGQIMDMVMQMQFEEMRKDPR